MNATAALPLGKMLTGWLSDGTNKYYMDPASGVMSTAWKQIDGHYHYFNNSGHMQTGWIQVNGTYYYLDPAAEGRMVAGTTRTIDGVTYQFAANGSCNTNVNTNNVYNGSSGSSNNGGSSSTPVVGGSPYSNGGPGVSSSSGGSTAPSPGGGSSTPGSSTSGNQSGDSLQAGLTGGPKP